MIRECSIGFLTILALYIMYTLGTKPAAETLIASKFMPGETISRADVANTATSMRLLQYHDYMRALEFEAEKEIAGCNSPPPIMSLLYG